MLKQFGNHTGTILKVNWKVFGTNDSMSVSTLPFTVAFINELMISIFVQGYEKTVALQF